MHSTVKFAFLVFFIPGFVGVGTASAANKQPDYSQRIERLERMVDNKGLVNLMVRLENLQKEVQILRGEVELQTHTLESIKKRQRDLYVDIDRRLLKLERAGTTVVPDAGNVSPGTDSEVKSGTDTSAQTDNKSAEELQKEQKAYQKAFELLRDLRYDKSIVEFRKFLKDFPQGRYAHIAQYWLGEANYTQRNYKDAIKEYTQLVANHPDSPKLAEALLKTGYCYKELKDYANARTSLEKLLKEFPSSTEAGPAKNLLKEIQGK
ncbi:MAG: tol-pal system protein YbgF [Gammaproteobacteria bacterium]|nr:tol-pal system protein YbgF [Gammaproteobacteria bacterium]MDH5650896.1 tol-pal system protein YbgF [Gammaproteobacteria bacterium]